MKTPTHAVLRAAIVSTERHSNLCHLLRLTCLVTRCENQKKRKTCLAWWWKDWSDSRSSELFRGIYIKPTIVAQSSRTQISTSYIQIQCRNYLRTHKNL